MFHGRGPTIVACLDAHSRTSRRLFLDSQCQRRQGSRCHPVDVPPSPFLGSVLLLLSFNRSFRRQFCAFLVSLGLDVYWYFAMSATLKVLSNVTLPPASGNDA